MIELPIGLPAELVPLSMLIGVWEGTGAVSYPVHGESRDFPFRQRASFSHDGGSVLNYNSYTWIEGDAGPGYPEAGAPLVAETGYWRLARPSVPSDHGPAMLPGRGEPRYDSAEAVETLRNAAGGFDIEVSVLHPDGVSELYIGQVREARIDLATDAVMRSASAKEYSAATRLYGLVEGDLLWAWDIAALGQDLRSHASARLTKVE